MRWPFLIQLKSFMSFKQDKDKGGGYGGGNYSKSSKFYSFPAAATSPGEDELDLTSKGMTRSAKRWSLGSDGEYAKVDTGVEADIEQQLGKYETENQKYSTGIWENGHKVHQNGIGRKSKSNGFVKNTTVVIVQVEEIRQPKIISVPVSEPEPELDKKPNENEHIANEPEKWKILFDKFDPEGFGEIPWEDFLLALKSQEFISEIERGKLMLLEDTAKSAMSRNVSTAITFQHFINILSGKRSRSFKCAVHQRDREVSSQDDFHLFIQEGSGVKRMARLLAEEYLTDERDRKYYAEHYTCFPPPIFIISVALIELGLFTYHAMEQHGEISPFGPLPIKSEFIYRPDKRNEIWRFLFYMVVHAGWAHLMFNLLVQLLVGLPLEMVHGTARVSCIYMAGVLAGSLGTSVFDPDVYLVGASGGVYALLAAHLANVLLNYNNMEFGIVRLISVFSVASADVGLAIFDRYSAAGSTSPLTFPIPAISYIANLAGALTGLTIGLFTLKNFEQRLRDHFMWWLTLSVYLALAVFAIIFNLFQQNKVH